MRLFGFSHLWFLSPDTWTVAIVAQTGQTRPDKALFYRSVFPEQQWVERRDRGQNSANSGCRATIIDGKWGKQRGPEVPTRMASAQSSQTRAEQGLDKGWTGTHSRLIPGTFTAPFPLIGPTPASRNLQS